MATQRRNRILDYSGRTSSDAMEGRRFSLRCWLEAGGGFVITLAVIVVVRWLGTMQAARIMPHTDEIRWVFGAGWVWGLWVVHFRWKRRAVTLGAAIALAVTSVYVLWCFIKLMRGLAAF